MSHVLIVRFSLRAPFWETLASSIIFRMPLFRIDRLPSGIRFQARKPKFGADAWVKEPIRHPETHAFNTSSVNEESRLRIGDLPSERVLYASSSSGLELDESSDECLPLLKVDVEVLVEDNIARTKLVQNFSNTTTNAIDEARYTFPLYDGAVVVAFSCSVGEERELVGKVQAKNEARAQYKKAVKNWETAALLEEHTPEIFETIIGNIPAETKVTVRIDYTHEIKSSPLDKGGDVRELIVPMSIAPRYGWLDDSKKVVESCTRMEEDGLAILVKVNNNGKIKKLHSKHHIEIEDNVPVSCSTVSGFSDLGKAKQTQSREIPPTQTIARYTSTSAIMDEDFIVSIEPHAIHPVQSRAVLSPTDENGYAALMVSVKPAEIFKGSVRGDRFDGEIIFVLDRSWSMNVSGNGPYSYHYTDRTARQRDTKISTLRRAMSLSLASLPATCRFNVVSFGDKAYFLWPQSQPYTQANLDFAQEHLQQLRADLGGTELPRAMKAAVESRCVEALSTQIILITDGEAESECVLRYVWNIRQELGDRIRFFALGIGINVPHRLINRIGELGGGYGEVVDIGDKPEWTESLVKMLSSGIMPKAWTCEIDLGPAFKRLDLSVSRFGHKELGQQESGISETVPYIQGPYPMSSLHPFTFRSVFFLLDLRSAEAPCQLTLKATANDRKDKAKHTLLIERTATDTTSIQHLAAKNVLLDLEAQMSRQNHFTRAQTGLIRQNATEIGVLYSITSRWTSYVAVEGPNTVIDEVELYRAGFRQGSLEDHLIFDAENFEESDTASSLTPPPSNCSPITGSNECWLVPHDEPSTNGVRPPSAGEDLEKVLTSQESIWEAPQQSPDLHVGSGHIVPDLGDVSPQSLGIERNQNLTEDKKRKRNDDLSNHVEASHITYFEAARLQDACGLFRIDEVFRRKLLSHFKDNTTTLIGLTHLSKFPLFNSMSVEDRRVILDTTVVIHYFRTHLALQEATWETMIDKAEYAVMEMIGVFGDAELDGLMVTLDLSAMHEHLDECVNEEPEQEYCPFILTGPDSCDFCRKRGKPSSLEGEGWENRSMAIRSLECAYCAFKCTGTHRFRLLWRHMVGEGHVCS